MCLGCDPTLSDCPATTQYQCQPLIANLWTTCNGVTLPDGIYYDPQQTVTGESISGLLTHLTQSVARPPVIKHRTCLNGSPAGGGRLSPGD
jgi:hypothetical protein